MDNFFLGKNLNYLLEKNGITNTFLADLTGVTRSSIGNYLTEKNLPKVDFLMIVSNHFNISCDDLLKTDLTIENIDQKKKVDPSEELTINRLIDLLEEKDKQITKLIDKIG